ncbi:hypothetical protein PSHT_01341, partial [Puccinia striiformis]
MFAVTDSPRAMIYILFIGMLTTLSINFANAHTCYNAFQTKQATKIFTQCSTQSGQPGNLRVYAFSYTLYGGELTVTGRIVSSTPSPTSNFLYCQAKQNQGNMQTCDDDGCTRPTPKTGKNGKHPFNSPPGNVRRPRHLPRNDKYPLHRNVTTLAINFANAYTCWNAFQTKKGLSAPKIFTQCSTQSGHTGDLHVYALSYTTFRNKFFPHCTNSTEHSLGLIHGIFIDVTGRIFPSTSGPTISLYCPVSQNKGNLYICQDDGCIDPSSKSGKHKQD